jgi:DNA-binding Lrp family transcriptional regulator
MAQNASAQDGLDGLDELDRKIIAALQMDGRASWTAIAERCSTSVATVARRGQQLFADGVVRVGVVPDIHHAGSADLFILRIGCRPGHHAEVAEELARREDIRFLALVTGGADIVAELNVVRARYSQHRLVDEVLAINGVERCETELLLHQYKVGHDWSRQLLTGEDHVYTAPELQECTPAHFDATDRAMLARLRDDGRASFRTIGASLRVNESTVRRRFETLLGNGCISVVTLVPAAALGFESEILFMIRVIPGRLDGVARELASYRGVRYVAATLGSSSLMCEVILPTTRDVFAFVTHTLGGLDGVQGWTAGVELLTLKRGFIDTPWSRSALGGRVVHPAVPQARHH